MKRILSCLLLLLVLSCSKINESNVPYYRVYMELDLRYQDKDLVGLLNHKIYTTPRNAGEAIGYAGIVVVSGFDGTYYAFDLCCPHEAEKSTKIVPDNTGYAKCPKCGTTYDIAYGSGMPSNGPSEYPLRRYRITSKGQELIVTN